MQRAILEVLDAKHGMASTKTLKTAMQSNMYNQSFYRSLQSLEKRGEIKFYRGGHNGGLVCKKHGNVLLIDADADSNTTFPNLALMKISSFEKSNGNNVTLQRGLKITNRFEKYDIIYISCVFTKNSRAAKRLAKRLAPIAEVHIGGSGVDLKTTLPDAIEKMMPDYSIYPECNYSMGFCSRGCPRSCVFCLVRKKEGAARPVADIYQFWNPKQGKKIMILDNNIFALPQHFVKIANQVIKEKLQVDFQSGLDIRLLDDEKAALLKAMHISEPTFAFDQIESEPAVLRGIEILKKHGINRSIFYVLTGFNSTWEEDYYRVNRLRELGQRVYVMPYNREELFKKDKRNQHLFNWANARMIFATTSYDEYVTSRENGSQKLIALERKERLKIKKNPPPTLHGCEISSLDL